MKYSFKKLDSRDTAYLRELLSVFADAFCEPQTYLNAQPSDEYLRSLLGKKHFIVLAAFSGDAVAGGLTAYVLDKPEQRRSEIYIYDLAVAAPHRRKGVAKALIKRLQVIARRRGAGVIFVQADKGDTGAIKLYESMGKGEPVYSFDIPVETKA